MKLNYVNDPLSHVVEYARIYYVLGTIHVKRFSGPRGNSTKKGSFGHFVQIIFSFRFSACKFLPFIRETIFFIVSLGNKNKIESFHLLTLELVVFTYTCFTGWMKISLKRKRAKEFQIDFFIKTNLLFFRRCIMQRLIEFQSGAVVIR